MSRLPSRLQSSVTARTGSSGVPEPFTVFTSITRISFTEFIPSPPFAVAFCEEVGGGHVGEEVGVDLAYFGPRELRIAGKLVIEGSFRDTQSFGDYGLFDSASGNLTHQRWVDRVQ